MGIDICGGFNGTSNARWFFVVRCHFSTLHLFRHIYTKMKKNQTGPGCCFRPDVRNDAMSNRVEAETRFCFSAIIQHSNVVSRDLKSALGHLF